MTAYGTADRLPLYGRFALQLALPDDIRRVQAATARTPIVGRLIRDGVDQVIRVIEPSEGLIILNFGDIELRADFRERAFHRVQEGREGRTLPPAALECGDLLHQLDELTWQVTEDINRLEQEHPKSPYGRAHRSWCIARLRLALGQGRKAAEAAENGVGILREIPPGERFIDPDLRACGEDLAARLETVRYSRLADGIREVLENTDPYH